MKTSIITLILTIGLFTSALAQNSFEGSITYEMSYLTLPPELAGMEAMLPTKTVKYYKGSKVRVEAESAGTGAQVVVTDYEKKTGAILMSFLGTNVAMEIPSDDLTQTEDLGKDCDVSYKKEVKEIAGIKCKKLIIEREDLSSPIVMYYTSKWANPEVEYGELKGLPLEMTLMREGMQIRYSATHVQEETVDDSMFEIPEGYELITQDELMELFGQ